jgi:SmpA / OmlA family
MRNRATHVLSLALFALPLTALAQARDPRVDALTTEIAQLKRTIADQDQRIAVLEKTVKALQALAAPAPERIPAPTPPWHQASNWTQIKQGMSEAQVVAILGPPTLAESVTDMRTLYYKPDPRSTTTLNGSVSLQDDRVTAMMPPAF